MLAELSTKLRDTFRFSENRLQAALYDLQSVAERIEITGSLHVVPDDPDDDMFVECALTARARWIISEDRQLLAPRQHQDVSILSAAEFIARIANTESI
jgi:predicted nucleic acid-binding protein